MTTPRPDAPPVRTFKPRRRPLTATRAAQWDELAPRLLLADSGARLDPADEFGRDAPLIVEIGIGFGEALLASAATEPDRNLIGIDVHTPGVAATLTAIDEAGITNVKLVHGDALDFLARLASGTLAGIRLFFPDPWPKARHRHRRMVAEPRLARLVDALAPGGFVHIATDIDDYARHAERTAGGERRLVGGVIDRPPARPVTRYERKGLRAGRTVTDLWFEREG